MLLYNKNKCDFAILKKKNIYNIYNETLSVMNIFTEFYIVFSEITFLQK
jgi:hypothetical protein